MTLRIAVHPDRLIVKGAVQSFSTRWIELAEQVGVQATTVNAFSPEFLMQLDQFDGFMWRFEYAASSRLFAKRLLSALEQGRGMTVYPDWNTAWHFEDKVSQHYLLAAAGLPEPATWIFWDRKSALEFCESAKYPFVLKLAFGFKSRNVKLIRSVEEARFWVDLMFADGVTSLSREPSATPVHELIRRARAAASRLLNRRYFPDLDEAELQHGYFYAQEFLPGNDFDTRVTVIGNRAFAFRRFNRPNDFRASGSGRIDWNPAEIDPETVRLGFRVAEALKTQSVAVDVLHRGDERVLNEISYTYAAWAVRDCPGHWEMTDGNRMRWMEGSLRPEDAIFRDFYGRLTERVRGEKEMGNLVIG